MCCWLLLSYEQKLLSRGLRCSGVRTTWELLRATLLLSVARLLCVAAAEVCRVSSHSHLDSSDSSDILPSQPAARSHDTCVPQPFHAALETSFPRRPPPAAVFCPHAARPRETVEPREFPLSSGLSRCSNHQLVPKNHRVPTGLDTALTPCI